MLFRTWPVAFAYGAGMPSALTMATAYEGLRYACEHNRSSKQAEARAVEGARAAAMIPLLDKLHKDDEAAAFATEAALAVATAGV